MGDPETETVLPLIESDFVELMVATAKGKLNEIDLKISTQHAATVMLVSAGYPGDYEKGKVITNLNSNDNSMKFHAGTVLNNTNEIVTNGGRVLAVTSMGNSLSESISKSMKTAENIEFAGKYFRTDIGFEFM
jgi:phosphoribosylamine--glycine ligase